MGEAPGDDHSAQWIMADPFDPTRDQRERGSEDAPAGVNNQEYLCSFTIA
jgi:hypothetical protein